MHIVTERCLAIFSRYWTNIRWISSSQRTKQLLSLRWGSQKKIERQLTRERTIETWTIHGIAWMHFPYVRRQMNMKNSFDEFFATENIFFYTTWHSTKKLNRCMWVAETKNLMRIIRLVHCGYSVMELTRTLRHDKREKSCLTNPKADSIFSTATENFEVKNLHNLFALTSIECFGIEWAAELFHWTTNYGRL